MRRARVDRGLRTGVNVIDIFTPLCFGQRIGIFAGSGVGKSTLLAMMTRAGDFDTVVLALTGERGREVREMLEETMAGHLNKTVTVVATGDESPMMRRLAPNTATAIAEYFRDLGQNVLLIVDSVTRFAHAAREVAIAAEEPPVSRGYPPSVFSQLPRLLERAGPGITEAGGSITGIYSVLVDGDDHNDPVSDTIRGTLDGHIVLDRAIAAQGRFPAVDIPASVSRLAKHNWTPEQRKLAGQLRSMVARFEETRDLRAIGAYQKAMTGCWIRRSIWFRVFMMRCNNRPKQVCRKILITTLPQRYAEKTDMKNIMKGLATDGKRTFSPISPQRLKLLRRVKPKAAKSGRPLSEDRGYYTRCWLCDASFHHLSAAR